MTDDGDTAEAVFRTSTFCTNGACVEVAIAADTVVLRDSKDPLRPTLVYTRDEWREFIAGVKVGEFDV